MPGITALVHTYNDVLRVGRCLETLYPCDELVIMDHGSQDGTLRIAHEYGARAVRVFEGINQEIPRLAKADWILCLDARESLTESLAASLYEWKTQSPDGNAVYSMFMREETAEGWIENRTPQIRLVPSGWKNWQGKFPTSGVAERMLEGDLLRFVLP